MTNPPISKTHPEIAAQWHPTLNGDLTPNKVSASYEKPVWWLGECGHSSRKRVNLKVKSPNGCLECVSIVFTNPDIAKEWHPTLNGDLTPNKVSAGSDKEIWWLETCGHITQSLVSARIKRKKGCSECLSLSVAHLHLAAEWHPTLNGDLTFDQISIGFKEKIWWLGKCGHEWEARLQGRAYLKQGCSVCAGKVIVAGFNDLESKNPELALEWHPTKNEPLKPSEIGANSSQPVWWLGKCGHEFQALVSNRNSRKSGCPFCSGQVRLVGFNDLESAYPEIAAEWHPTKNDGLLPSQVGRKSHDRVWWLGKCGHEWFVSPSNRTSYPGGCPTCANLRLLKGFNDLATTHPEIAAEWHPTKNSLSPDQVGSGESRTKRWWIAKCGHEWATAVVSRTFSGTGCPKCSAGGFSSADPGVLYFIHNPQLLAFKVGITNPSSKNDRLDMFKSRGWLVVRTWENTSGLNIQEAENKFFRWIRSELKIPRLLDKSSMKNARGASETFSDSILTKAEVIAKIEELLDQPI